MYFKHLEEKALAARLRTHKHGEVAEVNRRRVDGSEIIQYKSVHNISFTLFPTSLHYSQPPQHVIAIGDEEQEEDDGEADVFGDEHELLARLAARDNLIKEEKHVAAV